jgi:hypothetical protein
MTVEVDPDEGSGAAALVARVGTDVSAAHGVTRTLADGIGEYILIIVVNPVVSS